MRSAVTAYLTGLIDLAEFRERVSIAFADNGSYDMRTQKLGLGVDSRLAEHVSGKLAEREFRRALVELLRA